MENIGPTLWTIRLLSGGLLLVGPIFYLIVSLLISFWLSRWNGIIMVIGCCLIIFSKIPLMLNTMGMLSFDQFGKLNMTVGIVDRIGSISFAIGLLVLVIKLRHRIKDTSSKDNSL